MIAAWADASPERGSTKGGQLAPGLLGGVRLEDAALLTQASPSAQKTMPEP